MIKKEVFRAEYGGIGSRPYAKAVRAGDLIFVSGMAGIDPETGQLAVGRWEEKGATIKAQAKVAMTKIKQILEETGSSLDNIVYMLMLLVDRDDCKAVQDVMREFGVNPEEVAGTLIQAGLYPEGSRVELEVIATVAEKK